MKPRPSRTINPLHFEDLEPHRFEDLVRQLVYDFRDWITLEPLGRSGADEGIDIRGVEAVRSTGIESVPEDPGDDVGTEIEAELRVWFIQCKRERSFGPAKARAVATAAVADSVDPPHGFLLAVPTELSKQTRDTLAAELRESGVRQVIAWGRGDLEDLLFRPENDHLLFAYFGVSLQVRRRGESATLRNRLTKKRQVFRAIGGLDHRGWTPVLLRDPDEAAYPFRDRIAEYDAGDPPWLWTAFRQHSEPDMLALVYRRHHAWVSKNGKKYDFIDTCSHVMPHRNGFDKAPPRDEELCDRLWRYFHNEVPPDERAWLEVVGWIPFDDILLIDDLGDPYNEPPHVLLRREYEHGFFRHTRAFLERDAIGDHDAYPADELRRVSLFPDEIPDVEWKQRW